MKKVLIRSILLFTTLIGITACTGRNGREFIDRSGRTIILNGPVNRVVSTAPSNTEIIVDLGMADKLVAVDRYSHNVTGIPEGLTFIDFSYPDAEAILALQPDIVIANGHNVTGSGEDPFRLLREMGIAVAYISMSKSINDIYEDIAFVADVLQVTDKGDGLINAMKTRVDELTEKTAQVQTKRSVYIEISAAPEMITFGKDSYITDMISAIGARNIFGNDMWILFPSAEAIIERNPDVILTSVDYIDDPVAEIKNRHGFNHINAVINNRIYRLDTDSLVRPSPRIITALEQMAAAVYPEIYEQ
jgi:iron complex transport system substrate-binding protein